MNLKAMKPVILTAAAGIGVVGTAYLAAQGHLKAVTEGERVQLEDNKIKQTYKWLRVNWRFYAPATLCAIATISAMVGSHRILSARNAFTLGGLVSANRELGILRKSVGELPEESQDAVMKSITKLKTKEEAPEKVHTIDTIIMGDGDILWRDEFSGRYFTATQTAVDAAINEVNRELNLGDSVPLNTFYTKVGLPHTQMGDVLGWPIMSDLVETVITADIAPDGRPCLAITFANPPIDSYDRVWR